MKIENFIEKMNRVIIFTGMDLKYHAKLIESAWELYLDSFPEGYGSFIRDYDRKKFNRAIASSDYIKFIMADNNDAVLGFSMISPQKELMTQGAGMDTALFKKKLPDLKNEIFWIFIFMTKDTWKKTSSVTIPLGAKMFKYIFDNKGIAAFSRDLDEAPTLKIQIKKICKMVLNMEVEDKDISHEVTSVIYPIKK